MNDHCQLIFLPMTMTHKDIMYLLRYLPTIQLFVLELQSGMKIVWIMKPAIYGACLTNTIMLACIHLCDTFFLNLPYKHACHHLSFLGLYMNKKLYGFIIFDMVLAFN